MNTEIKSPWSITQGKLKAKWAELTDDDLQFAEGEHEKLIDRIQERTGESRDVIERAVKEASVSS
jgi:uncharacterized protein YjbJ (UPF0337 family)